jgi:hypothetical protein
MTNKVSFEVVNFRQEMKRVEDEVSALAFEDIEDRVNYAVETLKVVTPVDTGEARLGWDSEIIRGNNREVVDGSIFNDVEHISFLNDGSSRQAPKYFIEQVLTTIGILTPN